MRRGVCGSYSVGALISMFLLGLLLALVVPWAAVILLSLAVILAVWMLIQLIRC